MAAERIDLGRRCSRENLKTLMLANQKLNRFANRTIFDRDMVDERFRNREIVSTMTAILQDGGQTVKYGTKEY